MIALAHVIHLGARFEQARHTLVAAITHGEQQCGKSTLVADQITVRRATIVETRLQRRRCRIALHWRSGRSNGSRCRYRHRHPRCCRSSRWRRWRRIGRLHRRHPASTLHQHRALGLLLRRHVFDLRREFETRTTLDQHVERRQAIGRRRPHQRRLPPCAFTCVDRRPFVEQRHHRERITVRRRKVQRSRGARRGHGVHIGPGRQQRLHGGRASITCGKMQRRVVAIARHGIHPCTGIHQHLRAAGIAALRRPMQRRHAVGLRRVHIESLRDQQAHACTVPTHDRIGHRRLVCRRARRAQYQRGTEQAHDRRQPIAHRRLTHRSSG